MEAQRRQAVSRRRTRWYARVCPQGTAGRGPFGNAILSVGQRAGLDLSASTCTATVSLGTTDTGVGIAAALAVHIPGVDQATAEQLTAAAHESCPYSKATRGNIEVTITVTTD